MAKFNVKLVPAYKDLGALATEYQYPEPTGKDAYPQAELEAPNADAAYLAIQAFAAEQAPERTVFAMVHCLTKPKPRGWDKCMAANRLYFHTDKIETKRDCIAL